MADRIASDPEIRSAVDALTGLSESDRSDVLLILANWPTMPDAIKTAVRALVRATVAERTGGTA